jgi:hypothetical protein
MTEQTIITLLGLFATMVSVQVWIIKTLVGQNEKIVNRFLDSMEMTIGKNTAQLTTMSGALSESTTTIREHMAASRTEHETLSRLNSETRTQILDAIGKASLPRETASA